MAEAEKPSALSPSETEPPPKHQARRFRRPEQTDHPLPAIRNALARSVGNSDRSTSPPPQPLIPVIPPSPSSDVPSSPPSASPVSSDRPPKHLLDRSRPRCNSGASSSSALAPHPSSDALAIGDPSSDAELDENDNDNVQPRTRSRVNSPASWSSSGSSTGVASSIESGASSDAASPAATPSHASPPPRTAPQRKAVPATRVRRGPTAREKKELARQRRMDRRRTKTLEARPPASSDRVLRSRGPVSPTAPDAGLGGKVRELYI